MLNKSDLAKAINDAIGATDKDGKPIDVTPEMETYADAVITTLTTSTFTHLMVDGITAPASPLQNGSAQNGLFLPPLLSATWLGVMLAGIPTADPATLAIEATASTTYLSTASKINFDAGTITGQCTNTTNSPGPLVAGQGQQGKLDGPDGAAWSLLAAPPTADPALAKKIYDAIAKYIKENASASYLPQTINGLCPPGGGSLVLGIGAGGTIQ